MVREIMRDEAFLARKAEPAEEADLPAARDLLDTLEAHRQGCVGMAANMIGVSKRIIAFENEGNYTVMFNPEIIRRSERRRAVFPSPAPGRSSAGNPSRCVTRTNRSRRA